MKLEKIFTEVVAGIMAFNLCGIIYEFKSMDFKHEIATVTRAPVKLGGEWVLQTDKGPVTISESAMFIGQDGTIDNKKFNADSDVASAFKTGATHCMISLNGGQMSDLLGTLLGAPGRPEWTLQRVKAPNDPTCSIK